MFPLQAASFASPALTNAGRDIASFEGKYGASCPGMIASPSSQFFEARRTLPALQNTAHELSHAEATYNLSLTCFSNKSKNYWLSRLVLPLCSLLR